MSNSRTVSANQSKILSLFYGSPPIKVVLSQSERDKIWDTFKKNRDIQKFAHLKDSVPGIHAELTKALHNNKKIQAAVFSECVYSQAIANKFHLNEFTNYTVSKSEKFDSNKLHVSNKPDLAVRYAYTSDDGKTVLLQAGGGKGVDCALVSEGNESATMIEFKEPYARTSTPNLPKYAEDGYLVSSSKFEAKHPQFRSMIEEQIRSKLNIFEHLGKNVNDFSLKSIETAVAESYQNKKFADFICTEDISGNLVILPLSDIHKWARLEGELRPSGRNSAKVWTPNKLISTLRNLGAEIDGKIVKISKQKLELRKARGGENISGFKITPLFWVRIENAIIEDEVCIFNIDLVRQHIPDVTAKMNFENLQIEQVEKHYLGMI